MPTSVEDLNEKKTNIDPSTLERPEQRTTDPAEKFKSDSSRIGGQFNANRGNENAKEAAAQRIALQAQEDRGSASAYNLMTLDNFLGDLVDLAKVEAGAVTEGVSTFASSFAEKFKGNLEEFVGGVKEAVKGGYGQVVDYLNENGLSMENAPELFGVVMDGYKEAISGTFEAASGALVNHGAALIEAVSEGYDAASTYMDENWQEMYQGFVQEGLDRGLNEEQAEAFALAQVQQLDSLIPFTTSAPVKAALEESRNKLEEMYPENGLGANMFKVIQDAAQSPEYSGGRLASIAMYNVASGENVKVKADPEQLYEDFINSTKYGKDGPNL